MATFLSYTVTSVCTSFLDYIVVITLIVFRYG